jgi:hypothetical protein
MKTFVVIGVVVVALASSCPGGPPPEEITLTSLRTDIFTPRCSLASCHGGTNPERGLDLGSDPHGTMVNVPSQEDPNVLRVVPGDPDNSLLVQVLLAPVGSIQQMPPGAVLPQEDVDRIRAWIEAGAPND